MEKTIGKYAKYKNLAKFAVLTLKTDGGSVDFSIWDVAVRKKFEDVPEPELRKDQMLIVNWKASSDGRYKNLTSVKLWTEDFEKVEETVRKTMETPQVQALFKNGSEAISKDRMILRQVFLKAVTELMCQGVIISPQGETLKTLVSKSKELEKETEGWL